MKSRIIVAADVPTIGAAVNLARLIGSEVAAFKIGNELAEAEGVGSYEAVRQIVEVKGNVFRDGKFVDIPRTVEASVRGIVQPGLKMLNVMCLGGRAMMTAAKTASAIRAEELGLPAPLVLGVTVLTSLGASDLAEMAVGCMKVPEWHDESIKSAMRAVRVEEEVVRLALLAKDSGLDGVVCSAQEAVAIRAECGHDFVIVSPGIRSKDAPVDDQKRTMTVHEAISAGVDYMVIGRPIVKAEDPKAAVAAFNAEAEEAFKVKQKA